MQHRHCLTLVAVLWLIPSLAFAGPKKVTVTVSSSPEAALLYEITPDGERYWGQTPFRLQYALNGSNDCQAMQGLRVRWASGASEEITFLTICPKIGKNQTFMFTRPPSVPDAAIDWTLAQQAAALREADANARAMMWAGIISQAGASIQQAALAYQQTLWATRSVSCSSYRIGTYVHTSCY